MTFSRVIFCALVGLSASGAGLAQPLATPPGLAGSWVVDLSTKPDERYTKDMILTLASDGTVSGSFYDSAIEAGQWKTARGRTCASFRTSDGRGPYHTAVCLDPSGELAVGQTWAEQRTFLFNWNAIRKPVGE